MRIQTTLLVTGAMLSALVMSLPSRTYAAATGCTDAFLNGTYNVQVENSSIVSVLNSLRATPSTGTSTTLPPPPTGGFGSNPNSLGGTVPGLGRFYFDGSGRIVGQPEAGTSTAANIVVGTYSVNLDCTASFKLNSGSSFNAVVAAGGNEALFMGSDGVGGTMTRAANSCVSAVGSQQSFAFSLSGARRATPAATSGSKDSTPSTDVTFSAYSTLGSVTLNTDGTFILKGWTFNGSTTDSVNTNGTYTLGSDCSLRLSFANPTAAGTPTSLRGFLVNKQAGVLSVQPDASNIITTSLISQ